MVRTLIACGVVLAASASVDADGAVDEPDLSGGVTVVAQRAGEDAGAEATASLDLIAEFKNRIGSLIVYVEANAVRSGEGLATANADAATVAVGDGSLRLQVSELKYAFAPSARRSWTIGLLDPTVYLDSTRIDNDENMQFIGTSFVNNPSIGFPDYTIGAVVEQTAKASGPTVRVVACGSRGLGDNEERDYGELLDLTADGKGVFAAAEAGWTTPSGQLRLGGWLDTDVDRRGGYVTLGRSRGRHAAGVRLGWAGGEVPGTDRFGSVTYQATLGRTVVGLGLALAEGAVREHYEGYARIGLGRRLYLTPSIQRIVFDEPRRRHTTALTIRLRRRF